MVFQYILPFFDKFLGLVVRDLFWWLFEQVTRIEVELVEFSAF